MILPYSRASFSVPSKTGKELLSMLLTTNSAAEHSESTKTISTSTSSELLSAPPGLENLVGSPATKEKQQKASSAYKSSSVFSVRL